MKVFRSILLVLMIVSALAVFAQPTRTRLILKDGSYQIVTKYEVVGDRVRYMSAERGGDWEEVPNALVDWPATEKWNNEHEPGATPSAAPALSSSAQNEAAAIDKEEQAERADELARMPFVTTGLRLPDEGGVFVLDTFQGVPELVHVDQSDGDLNRNTGHNVLKAAINPMGGAKELIQIQGANAKVQLHVAEPVLYVSLDVGGQDASPDEALTVNTHGANAPKDKNSYSSPESKYAIVRVETHRNLRVIGAVRVSMLRKVTQSEDIIPTTAEVLPGKRWMKLTPKYPLSFGEYALVELLTPGEVNLDVWDFGVNPRAPENKHAFSPVHADAH
jgi:hypothetical protein